ncbi:MAG: cupin protein [Mucilaginibacter sp.]|nr:cupin protein [Mucilaginibacter sp.]
MAEAFASQTNDAYAVTEYELAPQFPGPPPHQHLVFEHAWYVLHGDLTVRLGDKIFSVKEGSFIFIRKLTVHAFANKTNEVLRVLVIDTPGGFENYYEDLQAAFGTGEEIDKGRMREIQLKYDTYPPDHQF